MNILDFTVLSDDYLSTRRQIRRDGGLARNLAYMIASALATRGLGAFYAILIRRILNPTAIGIWNLIEITTVYLSALTIGVSYSSERLIPYYRGQGRPDLENTVKSFLFSWTVFEGLIIALGIIIYVSLFGNQYSPDIRTGLYWLPVLFFCHKSLSFYLIVLKSAKEFRSYSVASMVLALLDLSLLTYAFFFGLKGLFAGATINGVAKLIYFQMVVQRRQLFTFQWCFRRDVINMHVPYGPSYSIFKLLWTVAQRLDAVLVSYLVGTQALAFYYLGNQLSAVVLEAPLALVYIAFPNLMEKLSTSGENYKFYSELDKYLRVNLYLILPVILPAAYFGAEFTILNILPTFAPGLWAIKIAIMAVGLSSTGLLYYQVLYAYQRIGRLTLITLSQLLFFIASYFIIRDSIDNPLLAVAVAAFCGQAGHFALALLTVQSLIKRNNTNYSRFWGADLLTCLFWAGLLLVIDMGVPGSMDGTIPHGLGQLVLSIALFILAASPLAWLGGKGLHDTIYRSCLNRLKKATKLV